MMRLLHRWADTQLRRDNERLASAGSQARGVAIRMFRQLQASRAEARALTVELAEMKKEQHQ